MYIDFVCLLSYLLTFKSGTSELCGIFTSNLVYLFTCLLFLMYKILCDRGYNELYFWHKNNISTIFYS